MKPIFGAKPAESFMRLQCLIAENPRSDAGIVPGSNLRSIFDEIVFISGIGGSAHSRPVCTPGPIPKRGGAKRNEARIPSPTFERRVRLVRVGRLARSHAARFYACRG